MLQRRVQSSVVWQGFCFSVDIGDNHYFLSDISGWKVSVFRYAVKKQKCFPGNLMTSEKVVWAGSLHISSFFCMSSTWSTKDKHIQLVCCQLQTLKPQLNNSDFRKQKRTGLFICPETALAKRGKKYLNALITDFIWNIATFRILVQIFMTSIALFTWCQCWWLLPLVMGIITQTPSSFL